MDLTIEVRDPTDDAVVEDYPFPDLIEDYVQRLFGTAKENSMLYSRLCCWQTADGERDQLSTVIDLLQKRPEARSGVFVLWRPEIDFGSDFPMSPVAGCFRLRSGKLHLSVIARSLDVWLGAVPELVAMSRLQVEVASAIGAPCGPLVLHAWSAHIYEEDLIVASADCFPNETPFR